MRFKQNGDQLLGAHKNNAFLPVNSAVSSVELVKNHTRYVNFQKHEKKCILVAFTSPILLNTNVNSLSNSLLVSLVYFEGEK